MCYSMMGQNGIPPPVVPIDAAKDVTVTKRFENDDPSLTTGQGPFVEGRAREVKRAMLDRLRRTKMIEGQKED